MAELKDKELNEVNGGYDSNYDIIYEKDGAEVNDIKDVGDYAAGLNFKTR